MLTEQEKMVQVGLERQTEQDQENWRSVHLTVYQRQGKVVYEKQLDLDQERKREEEGIDLEGLKPRQGDQEKEWKQGKQYQEQKMDQWEWWETEVDKEILVH